MSAQASQTPPRPLPPSRASARTWAYRLLAAVAAPALLLAGLEGALRLCGFGRPVRFLVPDARPGYVRTNPDYVSAFLPSAFDLRPLGLAFSERKTPNTLRVVVLGGSAAQGVPAPPFAFAAQLRAQLRARYPGRQVEVINAGIVAINSHVVYQIARELAGYSPDLFVVYMGNNEVVGPYGPGCAYLSAMPPLWVIRLSVFVRSTRTGQLASYALGRLLGRARAPEQWGGMAMFVNSAVAGDDPRLKAVYGNFEANLRGIVRAAQGAGARTLLCTVVSNLKDCAPFLSRHRSGMTESEKQAWARPFNRGRIEWLIGERAAARRDLAEALAMDPQYADTAFMLGTLELQQGDIAAARGHFVDAEHWDALRFRPDPRINEIVRRVASEAGEGVGLVDAAMALGSDPRSTAAPAGSGILFEHVHLDWEGNYRLSLLVAQAAEAVLPSQGPVGRGWLASGECAAAVGYTAHERYAVLRKVGAIVANPPFTNQLTYCEDEARLAHDLAAAKAASSDPSVLMRARRTVDAAIAADPENGGLHEIAENVLEDMGDRAGALEEARRALGLEPWNTMLASEVAMRLSLLGRFGEAEALLVDTAARCNPSDQAAMAPAFADLYTRSGRAAEGKRFLDALMERDPADHGLRVLRGQLEMYSGDPAGAERDLRAALAADPSSQGALEALLELLGRQGRSSDADDECLAALPSQPRNLANNLRAAVIFERRHERAQEDRCLLAAEGSGPVSSGVEISLARGLMEEGRPDDALAHLALARRVSAFEGNPAATASITEAIDTLLSRMR